MVKTHTELINSKSVIVTPAHEDRAESAEFARSKKRLKRDGHYKCWVCGSTDSVQIHHLLVEWSLQDVADLDKVKALSEEWDVYGYGKLLKNIPLVSVDDVRCLMSLCQEHHTGINNKAGNSTGIHNTLFPVWIMQKLSKAGEDPVPQEGQTIEDVEEKLDAL